MRARSGAGALTRGAGVLARPRLLTDVCDSISELAIGLDGVDRLRIEILLSNQRTNDRVKPLVVARFGKVLDLARESGVVSISH